MKAFISAASGAVPTKPVMTRPPSTCSRSSDFAWLRPPRLVRPRPANRSTRALVALEQHLDHARYQAHLGGTHQIPVLEQRGQIAFRDEVTGAAGLERRRQRDPSAEMVQRHEVDVDHRGLVVGIIVAVHSMATMLSVHIAPLGSPVLPDVYMIIASRWSVPPV